MNKKLKEHLSKLPNIDVFNNMSPYMLCKQLVMIKTLERVALDPDSEEYAKCEWELRLLASLLYNIKEQDDNIKKLPICPLGRGNTVGNQD